MEFEMKKIYIFSEFTAEERMTRIGGERLRHLILKEAPVSLFFESKPIASVSFFDEGIAKLILEGWSKEVIHEKVSLHEIHPRDQAVLDQLIKSRLG